MTQLKKSFYVTSSRNLEMRLLKTNVKVKKSYCYSYFEKNKLKSSAIWKGISSLVNIKVSKSSSIKLLNENKNLVSNPKIISNIFNHYSSTIGPEIERKIANAPGSFEDYFNKKDQNGQHFINSSNSSFFLSPTVPGEIKTLIDSLDTKKSTGPNTSLHFKNTRTFLFVLVIAIN